MGRSLSLLSIEIGGVCRVLQPGDAPATIVGPLSVGGDGRFMPGAAETAAAVVKAEGTASPELAVVSDVIAPDEAIRGLERELLGLGVRLRLWASRAAIARAGVGGAREPSADEQAAPRCILTFGPGPRLRFLDHGGKPIDLASWPRVFSHDVYGRFVQRLADRHRRSAADLQISAERLLCALHAHLVSTSDGPCRIEGPQGHAVDLDHTDVNWCLEPLRREVMDALDGQGGLAAVLVGDEIAGWLGATATPIDAGRLVEGNDVRARVRVAIENADEGADGVLVADDDLTRPRRVASAADGNAYGTAAPPIAARTWPRRAKIAVAVLIVSQVATAAIALSYRGRYLDALDAAAGAPEASERPVDGEGSERAGSGEDAEPPTAAPASTSRGPGTTVPAEDFTDHAAGIEFVAVTETTLTLPDGRTLRAEAPFHVARTEVTIEQFRRFAGARLYRTQAERGDAAETWRSAADGRSPETPVVFVAPEDAKAFCRWLSEELGRVVTLPTADLWELAARATSTEDFATGSTPPTGMVRAPSTGPMDASRAGEANRWGLVGVHGNVAEIVRLEDGYGRVGGSWRSGFLACMFASPQDLAADEGDDATGFRPVILGRPKPGASDPPGRSS